MFLTLFYFLLALLLLVTVHEYGHFLVARWFGVKVLRFSFGFGKIMHRWHDKRGTEYVISALPLGGYVKMLDEGEALVDPKERHLAFNNQPIYARIAIVLAGPLFNFILAFFSFWIVLMVGVFSLAPIIGEVAPHSMAAQAGLSAQEEIVAVNQYPIQSWQDFQYFLVSALGRDEIAKVEVKSLKNNRHHTLNLPLIHWHPEEQDLINSIGITPFIPTIPPIVGTVMKDSVAERAGFLSHDVIQKINGEPIKNWLQLVEWIKKNPNHSLLIQIKRDTIQKNITITPAEQKVNGKIEGYIGLSSEKIKWSEKWFRQQKKSPFQAAKAAMQQTIHLSATTFVLIGRLLTGQLSITHLSGPIGIAQGAGESGRSGFIPYLSFIGFISISLGVLNLLPIPILDGGQLVYLLIEIVQRKPISEQSKIMGFYLGFIFIIMMMFIAVYNDFSRLLG